MPLQRQRSKRWLAGWLLAGCACAAQAAGLCDALPSGQTAAAALATLRSLEPLCHKQAPFLYALGRLLNQVGQYDEAIDPLEGALLYRPEHWPSQLEYAIALEGIGDHDSALGLLYGLMQNPAVDAPTKQQIELLARKPAPTAPLDRHGTFSIATGYDNNLLGSTYHTEFNLTTPDGQLPVQLDEDQRPHGGSFVRADLSYDGLLAASASAQWRYSVVGSYRTNPEVTAADLGQFSALVERSTTGDRGPYLLGQHQTLLRPGTIILRQTQLGLGYDFSAAARYACHQRLGLDLQRLTYPENPELDGRYAGLISMSNCGEWGMQLQLRAGENQPLDASRPGGAQRQYSLRVSKRSQLKAANLALEWEVTHLQDQRGYSLLLDNNAQRSINRYIYRAEYRWLAGGVSPYIGFEWMDQRSNLTLFELKNRSITLGFRTSW